MRQKFNLFLPRKLYMTIFPRLPPLFLSWGTLSLSLTLFIRVLVISATHRDYLRNNVTFVSFILAIKQIQMKLNMRCQNSYALISNIDIFLPLTLARPPLMRKVVVFFYKRVYFQTTFER